MTMTKNNPKTGQVNGATFDKQTKGSTTFDDVEPMLLTTINLEYSLSELVAVTTEHIRLINLCIKTVEGANDE
ncbi:hypothetical protein [Shewanella sp. BJSY2023SW005]